MYLDRACIGWIINAESFQSMGLSSAQKDHIASAFFWAYALAQMPAGWLSDRYGARVLMTIYIATWSLCTAATSCSIGFMTLMIARLGTGLAEAGAYPASSSILTKWAHVEWRGLGSSIVSMGGRLGGCSASTRVSIPTATAPKSPCWPKGVATSSPCAIRPSASPGPQRCAAGTSGS
jgi:MFS family permease